MGAVMASGHFKCPNCGALFHLVKVEAGPETIDRELTCRACGGPLPGREGKLILKYLLLRKAGRVQTWQRRRLDPRAIPNAAPHINANKTKPVA